MGYDFNFGKSREGSAQLFKEQCEARSIEFEVLPPVKHEGVTVSSTMIRRLLFEGDFKAAEKLLGRRWAIEGEVTPGMRKGHELGFPTINLPSQVCLPVKLGVYVCEVHLEGAVYPAVCNIGFKPTFEGQHLVTEAHLFGFSKDCYGAQAQIYPIQFLRDERKFNSLNELSLQIQRDATEAKQFFRL